MWLWRKISEMTLKKFYEILFWCKRFWFQFRFYTLCRHSLKKKSPALWQKLKLRTNINSNYSLFLLFSFCFQWLFKLQADEELKLFNDPGCYEFLFTLCPTSCPQRLFGSYNVQGCRRGLNTNRTRSSQFPLMTMWQPLCDLCSPAGDANSVRREGRLVAYQTGCHIESGFWGLAFRISELWRNFAGCGLKKPQV